MNIVFDLDGTLIDSAPDIQYVANEVLMAQGREPLTIEETRRFVGAGAAVFVQRMMAARGLDDGAISEAALLASFLRLYENAVDLTEYYPGVSSVLIALKASGHRLAVCTNKPELPARAVMRKMALDELMDALIAGDMLPTRKPEPTMLLNVIEAMGGGASLYVGDSEIDAQVAANASVPFALFSGGYRKSPLSELDYQWLFDDFSELPAIVADASRLELLVDE